MKGAMAHVTHVLNELLAAISSSLIRCVVDVTQHPRMWSIDVHRLRRHPSGEVLTLSSGGLSGLSELHLSHLVG